MHNWSREQESILQKNFLKGASFRQLSELTGHTPQAVHNKVFALGLKRKYELLTDGKRLGHLDIESSQLNASFGFIVSYCIKSDGEDVIVGDKLSARDFRQKDKLSTDKRVVESLVKNLENYDVVTTFFGSYFDIPFIRSRALKHGLDFLGYGSLAHVDVWKWAKRNLKLHSHRLEAVAGHFGVSSKTKLEPSTWSRGTMGDLEAIDEIYEHNRQDVVTLEKVYHILKPYSAGTRSSL